MGSLDILFSLVWIYVNLKLYSKRYLLKSVSYCKILLDSRDSPSRELVWNQLQTAFCLRLYSYLHEIQLCNTYSHRKNDVPWLMDREIIGIIQKGRVFIPFSTYFCCVLTFLPGTGNGNVSYINRCARS